MRTSGKKFAEFLREMADRIEADDSFEGNMNYMFVERQGGESLFEVRGSLRVGNLQGQGGMILLPPEPMPGEEGGPTSPV